MILALEGPDCCGKTTLWEMLSKRGRAWKFVPRLPNSQALMDVMPEVELRQAALWAALYDPRTVYVCDRHVCVSAPVYDALYQRPCYVDGMLNGHIHVAYVDVPIGELRRRHAVRGDELFDEVNYARLCAEYERVLGRFQHFRLDGRRPSHELMFDVEAYILSHV